MSHELTIDFNDSSFDKSDSDIQPVNGVDVDVVFPISDDNTFGLAADNRGSSATSTGVGTGSASAIALMPDASASSVMEEFLFEFDNDLGDHDSNVNTPNPQGLKIKTEGESDTPGKEINIMGTLDNPTQEGQTLEIYVDTGTTEDHDSNVDTAEVAVFDKFSLGVPADNTGNDMAVLVSGDMDGADMGPGSDMAMINVDATADMSGLFQGGNGPGIDILKLVEGIEQDNGAKVDFIFGDYGDNSAQVTNYGGVGSGLNFQIAGWEVLELTGNADYVAIGSGTGKGLTDAYDAAYWNSGADNSMLKIMSGYTDNDKADVLEINANSNIYLSFEFVDTDQGIDAVFYNNGDVDVDDYYGSGSVIDVDVIYSGGTGLTIDYLEGTENADYVTNLGSKGITVDLGGSKSGADVFDGSVASKNDVLDARSVQDLTFEEDGDYIKVTNGTEVNAKLKDVDYIMVRDGAPGPEVTQAHIKAYDDETERLQDLKEAADKNLNDFDEEAARLKELKDDAQEALDTHLAGKSALETKVTQAETALPATDPSTLVVAPTPGAVFPASGAVGTAGVTDANDDGVVDLSDVQAFIDVRLDTDGKNYFIEKGFSEENFAQNFLDSTSSDRATYKTEMVDQGLTTASGFDDFINDLPQLVSSTQIEAYEELEDAVEDAKKDLQDHNTETTRLEGLRDTAAKNHTDYTSGSTRDDLVGEVNTAGKNLTDHTDVARPVLTDVDFYRDMSHLNDKYVIDDLGAGASDHYGKGYDVMTSAQVDEFGTTTDPFRVYYEGEHDDFIDTDDNVEVNSADGTIVMSDGDSTRGYNWEDQVEGQTQYGPGQAPGFYIEVNSKKLAVTFDDTKGEWKVDTSSIQVAEGASGAITAINSSALEGEDLAYTVADRFGIQLDPDKDHSGNKTEISGDIYLNATEEAITDLLGDGVQSESYNFDYYTKVDLQAVGGDVTVNVKLTESGGSFTLDFDDLDVAVESFHNVVDDAGAAISSSSAAGEFVKIDDSGDIALGNGGDDTYVIGATPKVDGDATSGAIHGGVALEYGDVGEYGGLDNSEADAVNINSVDSVDDLTFIRGKYRNEEEGSTLFIGDGKGNETVLFDNYNEYLDFRRVEYLTVEDGANDREIYEIVTSDSKNIQTWDNEIYVAYGSTSTEVEVGGTDYVFGTTQADLVNLNLDDIFANSEDATATVNLSGLNGSDTVNVITTDIDAADAKEVKDAIEDGLVSGNDGQLTVSYDYSEDKVTVDYDTLGTEDDFNATYDYIV